MAKKICHIAFVTDTMVLGGIERSLADLCWLLPRDEFDVTIILREKRGELLGELPEHVTVLTLPLPDIALYELKNGRGPCLRRALLHCHWMYAIRMLSARLKWYWRGHDYTFDYPAMTNVVRSVPYVFDRKFDLAVAYFGDWEWATCVTLDYLKADRKICWCHSEHPLNQMNPGLQRDYYSRFDYRFACSEATARRINGALGLPGLVKAAKHVQNPRRMKALADREEVCSRSNGVPVILTVGRLDPQKGIDIAMEVHRKLLSDGFFHHWYIVGGDYCDYRKVLQKRIDQYGIADTFFLEGAKSNPYPYFKRCDVYVQPSRFEGYCLTIAEARAFCKPVIATDFDGAREQLKDHETGLIVTCSADEISAAVKELFSNDSMRKSFAEKLSRESVDTQSQVLDFWSRL